MLWCFFIIFSYCELGERFSGQFDEINKIIDECNWYLLPIEMQRMLPTIMMTTQKRIYLEGFLNVKLIRETFKKVKFSTYNSFFFFFFFQLNFWEYDAYVKVDKFLISDFISWFFIFYDSSKNQIDLKSQDLSAQCEWLSAHRPVAPSRFMIEINRFKLKIQENSLN